MSILNSVTSFFEPKPMIPIPRDDCKPAKPDDCGDGKQSRWDDDHKGRDHWKGGDKGDDSKHGKDEHSKHARHDDDHKDRDHWKNGDKGDDSKHGKDEHSKHARHDDDHKDRDHWKNGDKGDNSKHGKDEHSKHARHDDDHKDRDHWKNGDKDDHSKHGKNDDCSDDGRKDGHSKHGGKDDYKDGKGDYSKDGKHDGGWKDAKNDDCQPHYCQPEKDYCAPKPSDDCGKGDTYHNAGEALAKFDFSHGDFGSRGPDHSGDMLGALASMPSGHALDYAIAQMGPADNFDIGHDDVSSHDTVNHA